ncbi:MAG: YceI family protein [Saprospiraceae bacterium]|nr:YceI family protein [Saprospiraceae bacterium]
MARILIIVVFCVNHLISQDKSLSLTGNVLFVSDAPLEIIKAKSEKMQGVIQLKEQKFAFSVPIKSFEGFNGPLQREHFNENYLESNIFPTATYTGKLLDSIDVTTDGSYTVRTKGKLTIHGITKERILKHKITVQKGILTITSEFTVLLSDHNITIPKIVFNKIAEEIKVSLEATCKIN